MGGARIFLKREDLAHTGAHKINNALGQGLLAQRMGKRRIIAETGAGQHGVATATVCAMLGLECIVYMGEEDIQRQSLNVFRMKLLGAEVRPVTAGSAHAQGRDQRGHARLGDQRARHLLHDRLGGRARTPTRTIVRDFQAVIGQEARAQIAGADRPAARTSWSPAWAAAATPSAVPRLRSTTPRCAWSASRRRAAASPSGQHAATLVAGAGWACCTARAPTCCRTTTARFSTTHSISAGLDYPGVGPEHSYLKDIRPRRVLQSPSRRRGAGRLPDCSAATRASSRRWSRRTPSPRPLQLRADAAARRR